MRVVALLAAYNERRFIASCLAHLERLDAEFTFVPDSFPMKHCLAAAGDG